ncbi:MAG: O-antigen ligase family protein, partial [Pirellulaceae bacterium]
SGSRGGMLVATACALYLVTEIPGRSRRFTMVTVATISLLALTLQFESLRERAIGRVWQLLDPQQSAADRTSGRSDLAVGAWLIFLDNPLGVGTGGFPAYWAQVSLRRDVGFSGYKRGEEQTCHSGWMKTLSENGVPGFLLLAGYVLSFGFTGWAQGVHGRIGVLTTVCLSLAFFSTEFAGKGLWFLAAGTCVLLSRHATTTTVAHEI